MKPKVFPINVCIMFLICSDTLIRLVPTFKNISIIDSLEPGEQSVSPFTIPDILPFLNHHQVLSREKVNLVESPITTGPYKVHQAENSIFIPRNFDAFLDNSVR